MHKPNRWVVIGTAATVAGFAAGVATTGGARGIDLNDPIVLEEVAEYGATDGRRQAGAAGSR